MSSAHYPDSASHSQRPTIAHQPVAHPGPIPSENTHLLDSLVDLPSFDDDDRTTHVFWEELHILTRYALPVFCTYILEFSLVMASVISIGHISTTALAAASLGSITANVTAFSVIQGFTNALDTLLPSAWTSSQPQLV
ncbi:hypothetical protein C0992_009802, partial [Termitomyces sp. T32_za158]